MPAIWIWDMRPRIENCARCIRTICALVVLITLRSDVALGGSYTIDASKFENSDRKFPECDLPDQKSLSPRIISLPLNDIEINLIEGRNSIYCISAKDVQAGKIQSLVISDYKFVAIHVSDLMGSGKIPFSILFSAGFFNKIAVTVFDGKIIVTHR